MSIFKSIIQWFKSGNTTDKEKHDAYRDFLFDLYSIPIDIIIKKNARWDEFTFSITPIDYRFSITIRHLYSKYSKTVHINGMMYAKLTAEDRINYIDNILQPLLFETITEIKKR